MNSTEYFTPGHRPRQNAALSHRQKEPSKLGQLHYHLGQELGQANVARHGSTLDLNRMLSVCVWILFDLCLHSSIFLTMM